MPVLSEHEGLTIGKLQQQIEAHRDEELRLLVEAAQRHDYITANEHNERAMTDSSYLSRLEWMIEERYAVDERTYEMQQPKTRNGGQP